MIKMERLIGSGFARSRNYILDTFDSMLFDMKQKVGVDKKDENFKFLVGETIIRTLGWESGQGGKFQNVQIVPKGEWFEPQRIVLTYEEESQRRINMPHIYQIKKILKYDIDHMSPNNIGLILKSMIEEMDEWLESHFHIKEAHSLYEWSIGDHIYNRLKCGVSFMDGYYLYGIPFETTYDSRFPDDAYSVTLRCKGDNLDMPYKYNIYNGRSNGKGYALEQEFNAIWGVPSFSGVEPTKVIFNGPATIVFWSDKTKTIVKRADNELDDKEKALAMCLLKKNEKLFKFCRKEAAKQEDKECEDIHDMVERFLNALTGGKDGN